ncbi:unnamed protein product [Toxocara canis]|uniref:DNA polymerase alpha subunit B n=1 Tax=Toxocara canis TaxID=6265 RepID=A0A183VFW9_TOXCA|nr:unnamed protein product [Toxocara canis]
MWDNVEKVCEYLNAFVCFSEKGSTVPARLCTLGVARFAIAHVKPIRRSDCLAQAAEQQVALRVRPFGENESRQEALLIEGNNVEILAAGKKMLLCSRCIQASDVYMIGLRPAVDDVCEENDDIYRRFSVMPSIVSQIITKTSEALREACMIYKETPNERLLFGIIKPLFLILRSPRNCVLHFISSRYRA